MKNTKNNLWLILASFFLICCTSEDLVEPNSDKENLILKRQSTNFNSQNVSQNNNNQNNNSIVVSNSEFIVQYTSTATPGYKDTLRRKYKVKAYEICKLCPDKDIEKWMFDDGVDIEPKKGSLSQTIGGGMESVIGVDDEFTFNSDIDVNDLGSPTNYDYLPYVALANAGITIAVVDTGFDHDFKAFKNNADMPRKFLYNASGTADSTEISGWDFANKDHNPYDDNDGRHGTIISYYINKILREASIPHTILPIKMTNSNGKASYFNALCSIDYAMRKSDIVQMSFGWYEDGNNLAHDIFSNLIDEYEHVILVTSAGNDGFNNDDKPHYPSSYPQENVIAVAAINSHHTGSMRDAASYSNFGIFSVDYYAPGSILPFPVRDGASSVYVSGTSFAAPMVAAKVAEIISVYPGTPSAVYIKSQLNAFGEPVAFTKGTKYNILINPLD